jgi:hypothetical protein
VTDHLEEAGEELFTFLSLPPSQGKGLRTTNALERIHAEFRRRTKTQASLPGEDAVLLLLFGLPCSGQLTLRPGGLARPATGSDTHPDASSIGNNTGGDLPEMALRTFLPLGRHYWSVA